MRAGAPLPPLRAAERTGGGAPVPERVFDLLAVGLALLLGGLLWMWGAHLDPTARDQVKDLTLALRIREGRALSDGNRHPLLPALLAPFAGRDPDFQTRALIVSVVTTVVAVLLAWRAGASAFGKRVGAAAVFVGIIEWKLQGRRICPEPIAAGLLVAGVAVLARAGVGARPLLRTGAGGAILGLAWLTKGSATLSLGAAALAIATGPRGGTRWGRAKAAGVLLAGFVATAWPLMTWNVSQGHGPLYNVNTAHVMWEDAWETDLDDHSTATPATWWSAHGVADAAARLGRGLVGQKGIEFVYVALGVFAIEGWRRRRAGRAGSGREGAAGEGAHGSGPADAWRRLAAWNGAVWLLAFAWYAPIVSSRRLLFPIFPVLIPPTLATVAGWGLGARIRAAAGRVSVGVRRAAGYGAAGLLAAGGVVAFVAGGAPSSREPIAREWIEVVEAIRAKCPPGSIVYVDSYRDAPPGWMVEGWARFDARRATAPRNGRAYRLTVRDDGSHPVVESPRAPRDPRRPLRRRALDALD